MLPTYTAPHLTNFDFIEVDDTAMTATTNGDDFLDDWLGSSATVSGYVRRTARAIIYEYSNFVAIAALHPPPGWRWFLRYAPAPRPTCAHTAAPVVQIIRRCRALRDRAHARRWKRRRFLQSLASVG